MNTKSQGLVFSKRTIKDMSGESTYLIRWNLPLLFGWTLKLHKILRADDDRCAHDHPFSFTRLILWGGYVEVCGTDNIERMRKPWRPWAPWRIYRCPTSFRHRIVRLLKKTSWTLVLAAPKSQQWGFFTKTGWMHWKEFVNTAWTSRVLWCDDDRELPVGTSDDERTPGVDDPGRREGRSVAVGLKGH